MRTFEDIDNRSWHINLTLGAAMQIDQAKVLDKDGNAIMLISGDPQAILKQIVDDYVVLRIMGIMVQGQLTDPNALQTEFYDKISQAIFSDVKYALWEELADFFPQATILFSRLIRSHKDLLRRSEKLQGKITPKMDQELAKIMDKAEQEALESIEELSTTTS